MSKVVALANQKRGTGNVKLRIMCRKQQRLTLVLDWLEMGKGYCSLTPMLGGT